MTGKICILSTATSKELRSCLANVPGATIPDQGEWELLSLHSRELLLLVTGVGPVNAAGALGRLLGAVGPVHGVVNLGIAGSFDLKTCPLATPVVVQEEIWPEFGLLTDEGVDPCGIGFSQGSLQGRPVFDRLALHPRTSSATLGVSLSPGWPMATSLSVAGVTGTPELAKTRQKLDADLENMEGFALGWTSLRFGLPFLEVRTISNRVGSRHKDDWDLKSSLAELGHVFSRMFLSTEGR